MLRLCTLIVVWMCVCVCACVRVCVCVCVSQYLSSVLPLDDAPTMVEILRILNLLGTVTGGVFFEKFCLSGVLSVDKHASNGLVRKNHSQHTATRCNTLQHTTTPQHTATHCNTLQRTAIHYNTHQSGVLVEDIRAGYGLVRKNY